MIDKRESPETTDRKAGHRMIGFVCAIFVIALILAGIWFFALTPGDPGAVAG